MKFFWTVGKAFAYKGAGYVPLHKVGGFGEGFFTSSEGVLLRSDNILTERDPRKIRWETLPDGEIGLRTPAGGGPVAEEQSFSVMSDGSIFCVYRTIDGHPPSTYSRDGGVTWDAAAVHAVRGWPSDEASARGQLRLALRERQVPLLVSQSRRPVHSRTSETPHDRL